MRRLRGAAGIAALCVAAFSAGAASGASLPTLIASKHVAGLPAVTWGKSITLSGHESLGGTRSFVLQAQPFPFMSGFHTIATGKTTGSYAIAVKPSHATRYRVRVGSKTSPVLTVYVLYRTVSNSCNLCHSPTPGTHTLVIKAKFQAPPGPIAVHGPVYFYYAQNNSTVVPTTLHRAKTVPLHISGDWLSYSVSYAVHFPTTSFRFQYAFCDKDAESNDGVGLPGHHHCGNPTITSGEYLG